MGFVEYCTSYVLSSTAIMDAAKKVGKEVSKLQGLKLGTPSQVELPPNLKNLDVSKLVHSGGPIIRVAAISGAAAVMLGAYGRHTLPLKDGYEEREMIYDSANQYHFFHTLALFGAPLSRFPKTAASLFTVGILLFCGTCYYQAFTGKKDLNKLTPIGGISFILGWLCLVL